MITGQWSQLLASLDRLRTCHDAKLAIYLLTTSGHGKETIRPQPRPSSYGKHF